ncbi:MAG: hypothetical protein JXX29_21655 [Deltaproteobacteria bacterium]|nr:hypothetical protein [Deltaproteobacteria bacterium]MBN2674302.1 hypothetical protein [Deltaproteobacteria bacterium]
MMNNVKELDILIGVKTEQSLRDAVRALMEQTDTEIELTPVGRKDWIAGERIGASISQLDLEETCRRVHRKLMALGAEQRIRFESIKLYAVAKPVPVFKDPDEPMTEEAPEKEVDTEPAVITPGPSVCPICNRTVHSYNLHYSTDGKVVGCFMCGGNKNGF